MKKAKKTCQPFLAVERNVERNAEKDKIKEPFL